MIKIEPKMQFNNLTTKSFLGVGKSGHKLWKCKCKCGQETVVTASQLRNNGKKSCGCLKNKERRKDDIIGSKYGDIEVLSFSHKNRHGQTQYKCKCKCGKIWTIGKSGLRTTKQCYECSHSKHSGYEQITKSYWSQLIRGANRRGFEFSISMEEAWYIYISQNGRCALSGKEIIFGPFDSYEQTASLDRIDSNKGYIKDNVQWVHKKINAMKSDLSDRDFIEMCREVSDYQSRLKCLSELVEQAQELSMGY